MSKRSQSEWCAKRPGRFVAVVFFSAVAIGCGGGRPEWRTLPVPQASEDRHAALQAAGRAFFAALADGRPGGLLLDDPGLSAVLLEPSAERFRMSRRAYAARSAVDREAFRAFGSTRFLGLCLQGVRLTPAGPELGLREPAWTFERALVIGGEPMGSRFAAWVEGTFVYTNQGFMALVLARAEAPRWQHSDLELATCDVEVGGQ